MVYVENEIIGRRLRRIRLDFGYDYFEMGNCWKSAMDIIANWKGEFMELM